VFVNNTTKGERDPRRGRRSFETGEYEQFPELYFTVYQPDGRAEPYTGVAGVRLPALLRDGAQVG
ncbi:MAG: hypothetical protein QGG53_40045, partial [Planctomycetota bacterium]|nr:hypothetical protein [Planctomycetota bacterium]